MAIDPTTGLYVNPSTENPGPFGGVMQIMNAMRGGDLSQQAQQERDLKLYMDQLAYAQSSHEYQNELGYQHATQQAVNSGADPLHVAEAGLPYGKPPGPGLAGQLAMWGPKENLSEAALNRAGALQSAANAKNFHEIATMARTNADAIPLMRQAGLSSPELEQSLMLKPTDPFDPNATAQMKERLSHASLEDARAKSAPMFARAALIGANAKTLMAQARSAAAKKSPDANKQLQAAERLVTAKENEVARLEHQLGNMAQGMTDDWKTATTERLQKEKAELSDLQHDRDQVRVLIQNPPAVGQMGANTTSVGGNTDNAAAAIDEIFKRRQTGS